MRRQWLVFVALLVVAAAFRIAAAHWLPNDSPDDGRVYAQIARNVLEQHLYSHATEPPYDPSLIRLPGYPLFVAGIYSIFGHGNNGAVRFIQALIDTGTCALVALLAFQWEPDESRKRTAAIAALCLAAVCPFTTIYSATILTEVPATFLAVALGLAATLAFRAQTARRAIVYWCIAGAIAGLAVLFRPDSGLFAAAIGFTLLITGARPFWSAVAIAARPRSASSTKTSAVETDPKRRRRFALPAHSKDLVATIAGGAVFTLAFVLVLVPWTIRNARVFHLFQPLAPTHGEMPDEFVPRGYNLWVRTWLDDERYIGPFLWSLDTAQIDIDEIPSQAFDSEDEKNRVVTLFEKYNHPPDTEATNAEPPPPTASPQPMPSPQSEDEKTQGNESNQTDEGDASEESDQAEEPGAVEMTPEIDAGFARIARERIARHPFRFYLWLPLKRAETMWFDTHSQYWPFEGELLPFEDLDYEHHQQFWLPLFGGLTAVYTLLGIAGAWLLWSSQKFEARRWLLLVSLIIFLRVAFFSLLENPEPRYLVEFFPLLAALGGIAMAQILRALAEPQMNTDSHG